MSSRIALLADSHIYNAARFPGPIVAGLNRRCRQALAAFEAAIELANARDCSALVVAGDLVDNVKPSPQIVAAIQRALERFDGPRYLLVGNHDQESTELGDHALGPFAPVATVVERPLRVSVGREPVELWLVPFHPEIAAPEWIRGSVQALGEDGPAPERSLLVVHAGVADSRTAEFLQGAKDSIEVEVLREILDEASIAAAAAGNWHERRRWERIQQIGATAPTGWNNPGPTAYGWLAIYDAAAGKFESVRVPGPRFLDVTTALEFEDVVELARDRPASLEGCALYVRWVAKGEELAVARDAVAVAVADGTFVDGAAEPDIVEQKEKAEEAATLARSADSLREALVEYVGAMPLAPPIGLEVPAFRELVLSSSITYLGL